MAKLRQTPTPWVKALLAQDTHAWNVLDRGLRDAYQSVLATSWTAVRERHAAEFTRFALRAAENGIEPALTTLAPGSTLTDGTWHIPAYKDRDHHRTGNGLTLLPTFHWSHEPLVGFTPEQPLLLVYPAGPGFPPPATPPNGDPLADVLGTSRARILRLLEHPHTTTELAAGTNLSLAAASSHSTALRRAGLITTPREGRSVRHTRTELGRMLTEAGPA